MQIRQGEISLYVSDIARSVAFYADAFGFLRIPDPAHGEPDGSWDKLASGDFVLTLFRARSPEPMPGTGARPMMSADILVNDLDEAVRRLRKAGARLGAVRDWPGGRVVHFFDPDGIGWELISTERQLPRS